MNKVIKKSLTATLLSVFVLGLGVLSAPAILSIPTIPIARAAGCTVGASIANPANDLTPSVSEEITYTLSGTISNLTDPTAVTVNDALSAGLTFVSSTASIGSYSSSTGVWDLGTVSSSTSMPVSLQISATVNAGTEGEIIDSEPTINYSQSVGASCAQSAAINGWSMTVTGTPVPPSADLAISKTANVTSTTAGSTTTVDYTITVTNNSTSTTSTDVVATDTLPSALTFESATTTVGTSTYATSTKTETWTIGALAPSSTVTLDLKALVDTSASSTIANTATVSASTTDPNTANNSSTVLFFVNATSTPTSTPSADISINKTVDNTNPSAGGTVNYTIIVTNNSTSTTSTDVVASDTLPSTLTFEHATTTVGTSTYATSTDAGTWTFGNLAPNATATLQIAALVNAGDAGDTIANTATVSASTTDPDVSNNSSTVTINVQGGGCGSCSLPNVDLAISKIADVTSTFVGDPINYTIVVTNLSSSTTSTGVVATDTLPSGLTFENATASASTSYASSTGTWTIGALAPNATATLQIATLVTGPGVSTGGSTNSTITNTATVSESPTLNDPDMSNNSSSVSVLIGPALPPTGPDLVISKTVDNANPAAGNDVNYTIAVANNGSATSTFVDVQDVLPLSLSIVSSTISQGSSTNAGTFDWNVGTLAPNATATLVLDAAVGSNQAGNAITNTAIVFSQSNPSLVASSSVTINVQGGGGGCTSDCGGGGGSVFTDMSITKTVDNATPATGATIHYTLTVKDAGQNPTLAVMADDILPAGLTFVSATSSLGFYASSTGAWKIGALNAGQAVTLTITAMVTAPGGTAITNTATVSQTPTIMDPVASNNSSSVTINVAGGGQVLGASTSTGQVLGASCGLYLTSYIHPNRQNLNDSTEVKKLQTFLNQNLGINLPVTGYYGSSTIAAVDQFQVKYHNEVLTPWVSLGLPTPFTPTNYVYQSTQRWINLIMCPSLNLPLPVLKVDNGE